MGVTAQAFDGEPFVIPLKSDPPPAVDGQLNEWINRPGALKLDRREQVTLGGHAWKSTSDLSARAWLAWRHDVFHFAISVTDDQLRSFSQRGSHFLGDHVKLFLDVAPENEPARDTLGTGQFKIVLNPGNFSRAANQGSNVGPTVHVNDLKFDGGKIAATQTPEGYDLEAAIPWSHFGVATPSNGMAVRFEIAVEDTDGDEARPAKIMTSSTNAWALQRKRLVAATLGDTSGRAPENTAGQAVFGDLRIENGQSVTNAITIQALPADRDAVLTFKARLHFDTPAGNALSLQVRVNGRIVNSSRLLNKPQYGKSSDGRMHALSGGERITTFYAPDFTSADNSAYGIEGVKTSEFELRLSGLLREGVNELVIVHAVPSVKVPLIVADGRLVFRKVNAGTVAQAGPPTGALETFRPATAHKVPYTVKELPESRLEVELNGERFLVESDFSTPAPGWERGGNKFFGHRREILKQDETILVRDTFTNLTADSLPLMQRHQARFSWDPLESTCRHASLSIL